jgi:single-strand DNA-binding protein
VTAAQQQRSEPGLNVVYLIGRIGKEPEFGYTRSQMASLRFRMATSESWKDGSGETKEATEWHTIVQFGRGAEAMQRMLQSGTRVHVTGKLRTRKWEDKEGKDRYSTEVVADRILPVDKLKPRDAAPASAPATSSTEGGNSFDGDDYPF